MTSMAAQQQGFAQGYGADALATTIEQLPPSLVEQQARTAAVLEAARMVEHLRDLARRISQT